MSTPTFEQVNHWKAIERQTGSPEAAEHRAMLEAAGYRKINGAWVAPDAQAVPVVQPTLEFKKEVAPAPAPEPKEEQKMRTPAPAPAPEPDVWADFKGPK